MFLSLGSTGRCDALPPTSHNGLGKLRVLCASATPRRQLTAAPSSFLLSSLKMTQVSASGRHGYLRV
ncbi:uncharacterized protein PpBr36_09709 [Pyricularia pennisetigena]|uniref:uncharacterized protein n=1 Tax=Pyricularia pennisetigena TaxID=1578925 RepID=UPI00114F3E87|nr:uncharacterized protein PpBr36_09709 [Pyricularia pennisetigena]TLS22535.1 hypothetical protein PpBr36_09709 [Pyricularia pennisetigena]